MILPETLLVEIRAHAEREYQFKDAKNRPRESCGLVVVKKGKLVYLPVRNVAESNEHFVMHAEDQALAEDTGEIAMVVHSHPNISPLPSQADLVGCESSGVPWLIVNWPTGVTHTFEPSGYVPPLYGRVFAHGILDCYSFIEAYYLEKLDIKLPEFKRPDEWWLKGQNLYLEGFESAGFEQTLSEPQTHDVLLMQLASQVPNHGAIYLGDGCIGHHQMNRLSSRDIYGGWFEKITVQTLRHKTFL